MEYLSGESWAGLCDEAYGVRERTHDFAPLAARDATIIYCHTDWVWDLFRRLRLRTGRFAVVTSESDHAITAEKFAARPWNVVEWFSVNALAPDVRCRVIPRGLANASCDRAVKADQFRECPPLSERPNWLYVNHRVETNVSVRQPVYDYFRPHANEGWVTVREAAPPGETAGYLEELQTHRFVCAPPGNGVDTHRMWEALYAGAVPIVLRGRVTEAFADLPISLVESYSEVTPDFLRREFDRILNGSWNLKKLSPDYWRDEFNQARRRIAATPRTHLIREWMGRKLNRF